MKQFDPGIEIHGLLPPIPSAPCLALHNDLNGNRSMVIWPLHAAAKFELSLDQTRLRLWTSING